MTSHVVVVSQEALFFPPLFHFAANPQQVWAGLESKGRFEFESEIDSLNIAAIIFV